MKISNSVAYQNISGIIIRLSIPFQLASDISEVKAMSLLKESEESMQKLVRSTKNNIESQEHKEALSVCSRLKFYRHFFLALSFLAKQDINDAMRYFLRRVKNSNQNSVVFHIC